MSDLPFDTDEEPTSGEQMLASNVLVVDDELVVRDVLRMLLQRETDLIVYTAETAEAALSQLRTTRFDLLITDKNLPGMGGIELIAEARKRQPALEAIVITGYASAESVLGALAAGASDYLTKPFDDLKVVRARVRAALDRSAERTKGRVAARALAAEASKRLAAGEDASEPVWTALELALREYEQAPARASAVPVKVVGREALVQVLRDAGLTAGPAAPDPETLGTADVVVLDTERSDWRELADALSQLPCEVVLVARQEAELSDLLDALSLHMDLVGFGGGAMSGLAASVQSAALRRVVERAQEELARALDGFTRAVEPKR